jgi:hypothetical protein
MGERIAAPMRPVVMPFRPVVMPFVPDFTVFDFYDVSRFALGFVAGAAAHRDETGGTELGMFRFHASGDFRHVGNEFRAEPHGIGRARLPHVGAALSLGAVGNSERRGGKQRQQTDKTHDPHGHFPDDVRVYLRTSKATAQDKNRSKLIVFRLARRPVPRGDRCSLKGGESTVLIAALREKIRLACPQRDGRRARARSG